MTDSKSNARLGNMGPASPRAVRAGLAGSLAAMMRRVSTKARWFISAALGLIAPAALIAESGATPIVAAANALLCFGNGSFMTLAASANAFTIIP